MRNGETEIRNLVAKSENVAADFRRTQDVVSSGFYCLFRECGDKGGRWIVRKAGD